MTPIITELVYIFVKGPAEERLWVREFLAALYIWKCLTTLTGFSASHSRLLSAL